MAPKTARPCGGTRSGERRFVTENGEGMWNVLTPPSTHCTLSGQLFVHKPETEPAMN